MKSFFAIAETLEQGRKIVFCNEDTIDVKLFQYTENDYQDSMGFTKDKIQSILQQTQYFGIVKNSNYLGFSADFVIDFFSPSKLLLTNELMIDDHMYLVSTLQFKDQQGKQCGLSIVIMISRDSLEFGKHCQYCLKFLVKALEQLEEEDQYISKNIFKTFQLLSEFEQRLLELPSDCDRQKLRPLEIIKHLAERVPQLSRDKYYNCEIRKQLLSFQNSIIKGRPITISNFKLQLPIMGILQDPINITIKPYQTMQIHKPLNQSGSIVKSPRFQKFLESIRAFKSFQWFGNSNNYSMTEIQFYVNHLLMNDAQGCIILLNEMTQDQYFVLNSNQNYQKFEDKFHSKFGVELISVVKEFDKPQSRLSIKSSQLKDHADFKQIFMYLIGMRIIKETQTYLYQLNPFLTNSEIQQQVQYMNSLSETDSIKQQQYDLHLLSNIAQFYGQQVSVYEIAHQLKRKVNDIWQLIRKYNDIIGYYFI